ncbi:MAG TPA: FKBP-type peptidyl-prolyl cis-trans isomerase, partial [Blastocatellia bacterium]|nr:FKBP-type peptidyl-prolyl cis-trans isomerase [Blastocatellia bacterium]
MMRRIILLFLSFCLLTQLACQSREAASTNAAPVTTPSATPTAATLGALRVAPSGLQYQDLVLGTGRRPMIGQSVTVKYVGKLENGKVFEEGKFEFKLGEKDVLPGFNQGIAGGEGIDAMKVDGKRLLI